MTDHEEDSDDDGRTLKWFGRPWGSTFCTADNEAPLPQVPCDRCGKAFAASDSGLTVPFYGGPGDPPELAYHLVCWRALLGLVADGELDE